MIIKVSLALEVEPSDRKFVVPDIPKKISPPRPGTTNIGMALPCLGYLIRLVHEMIRRS